MRHLLLPTLVLLVGCPTGGGTSDDDDSAVSEPEPKFGSEFVGGDRPTFVHVPDDYDGRTPTPLVILLHGRGATPDLVDYLVGWRDLVDVDDFFLLVPESETDAGVPRWNWQLDADYVDDVGYITGLIDQMTDEWSIDADRIVIAWHSNGGYMSYRMACTIPSRLSAVMPYAGLYRRADVSGCDASASVSVLHLHGTADGSNGYEGSESELGVQELGALWAERAGCSPSPTDQPRMDLTDSVEADETRVQTFDDGCTGVERVTVWSMEDGGHNARLNDLGSSETIGWLLDQRRGE